MQDKDSIRGSINKRMDVVHRCIRTPNIVLRALREFFSTVNYLITIVSICQSNSFFKAVKSWSTGDILQLRRITLTALCFSITFRARVE